MGEGRDTTQLLKRLVKGVERVADANEALIGLAREEQVALVNEGLPLCCPTCGSENPVIEIPAQRGRLQDWVFVAKCDSCKGEIVAVAGRWDIVANSKQEVITRLKEGGK